MAFQVYPQLSPLTVLCWPGLLLRVPWPPPAQQQLTGGLHAWLTPVHDRQARSVRRVTLSHKGHHDGGTECMQDTVCNV